MEKITQIFISKFLNKYFSDVEKLSCRGNFKEGTLAWENLFLNSDILSTLDLNIPYEFLYGKIGTIKLNLNYSELLKNPFSASLDNITIVLKEKLNISDLFQKNAQKTKNNVLKLVESWEKDFINHINNPETHPKTFWEQILENMQINLRNLSIILICDDGWYKASIEFISIGKIKNEIFEKTEDREIYISKSVLALNISLQFSQLDLEIDPKKDFSFASLFEPETVVNSEQRKLYKLKNVLNVLSFRNSSHLLRNNFFKGLARIFLKMEIPNLKITLDEFIYRNFIRRIRFIYTFNNFSSYKNCIPLKRPIESPLEWWKYIFITILNKKKRILTLNIKKLSTLLLDRKEYLHNYKNFFTSPFSGDLDRKCIEKINEIEKRNSIENIIHFRKATITLLKERNNTAPISKKRRSFGLFFSDWNVFNNGGKRELMLAKEDEIKLFSDSFVKRYGNDQWEFIGYPDSAKLKIEINSNKNEVKFKRNNRKSFAKLFTMTNLNFEIRPNQIFVSVSLRKLKLKKSLRFALSFLNSTKKLESVFSKGAEIRYTENKQNDLEERKLTAYVGKFAVDTDLEYILEMAIILSPIQQVTKLLQKVLSLQENRNSIKYLSFKTLANLLFPASPFLMDIRFEGADISFKLIKHLFILSMNGAVIKSEHFGDPMKQKICGLVKNFYVAIQTKQQKLFWLPDVTHFMSIKNKINGINKIDEVNEIGERRSGKERREETEYYSELKETKVNFSAPIVLSIYEDFRDAMALISRKEVLSYFVNNYEREFGMAGFNVGKELIKIKNEFTVLFKVLEVSLYGGQGKLCDDGNSFTELKLLDLKTTVKLNSSDCNKLINTVLSLNDLHLTTKNSCSWDLWIRPSVDTSERLKFSLNKTGEELNALLEVRDFGLNLEQKMLLELYEFLVDDYVNTLLPMIEEIRKSSGGDEGKNGLQTKPRDLQTKLRILFRKLDLVFMLQLEELFELSFINSEFTLKTADEKTFLNFDSKSIEIITIFNGQNIKILNFDNNLENNITLKMEQEINLKTSKTPIKINLNLKNPKFVFLNSFVTNCVDYITKGPFINKLDKLQNMKIKGKNEPSNKIPMEVENSPPIDISFLFENAILKIPENSHFTKCSRWAEIKMDSDLNATVTTSKIPKISGEFEFIKTVDLNMNRFSVSFNEGPNANQIGEFQTNFHLRTDLNCSCTDLQINQISVNAIDFKALLSLYAILDSNLSEKKKELCLGQELYNSKMPREIKVKTIVPREIKLKLKEADLKVNLNTMEIVKLKGKLEPIIFIMKEMVLEAKSDEKLNLNFSISEAVLKENDAKYEIKLLSEIIKLTRIDFLISSDKTIIRNGDIKLSVGITNLIFSPTVKNLLETINSTVEAMQATKTTQAIKPKKDLNGEELNGVNDNFNGQKKGEIWNQLKGDCSIKLSEVNVIVAKDVYARHPFCYKMRFPLSIAGELSNGIGRVNLDLPSLISFEEFYGVRRAEENKFNNLIIKNANLEGKVCPAMLRLRDEDRERKVILFFTEEVVLRISPRGLNLAKEILKSIVTLEDKMKTKFDANKLMQKLDDDIKKFQKLTYDNNGMVISEEEKTEQVIFDDIEINFEIEKFKIVFLNDIRKYSENNTLITETISPLITVTGSPISFRNESYHFSKNIICSADLEASFFNTNLNCYEPLIEPNKFVVSIKEERGCKKFSFNTNKLTNVNVTGQMIRQVLRLKKSLLDFNKNDERDFKEIPLDINYKNSTLIVQNETEISLSTIFEGEKFSFLPYSETEIQNKSKCSRINIFFDKEKEKIKGVFIGKTNSSEHYIIAENNIWRLDEILEFESKNVQNRSQMSKTRENSTSSRKISEFFGIRKKEKIPLKSPFKELSISNKSRNSEKPEKPEELEKSKTKTRKVLKMAVKNKAFLRKSFYRKKSSVSGIGEDPPDETVLFGNYLKRSLAEVPELSGSINFLKGDKVEERVLRAPNREHSTLFVCIDVTSHQDHTRVHIHSETAVENKTQIAVEIEDITLEPGEKKWLPFSFHIEKNFYVRPFSKDKSFSIFKISSEFLFRKGKPIVAEFEGKDDVKKFFSVIGERETGSKRSLIRLTPTVKFSNLIPETVEVNMESKAQPWLVRSGDSIDFLDVGKEAIISSITIPFLGLKTVSRIHIYLAYKKLKEESKTRETPIKVIFRNSKSQEMRLSATLSYSQGSFQFNLFSYLWLVDYSEWDLLFSSSDRTVPIEENYNTLYPRDDKIRVKMMDYGSAGESVYCASKFCYTWSKPLQLNGVGAINYVENLKVKKGEEVTILDVGYTVRFASKKFFRTKLVRFFPKYIIKNTLPFDVIFKTGNNTNKEEILKQQESRVLYFTFNEKKIHHTDLKPAVSVRDQQTNYDWSEYFQADQIGENILKLVNRNDVSDFYFVSIDIVIKNATHYVVFFEKSVDILPYAIENRTFYTEIEVKQKESGGEWLLLQPFKSSYFYWDKQNAEKTLEVRVRGIKETERKIKFETGEFAKIKFGKQRNIKIFVFFVEIGVTNHCVISNFRQNNLNQWLRVVPNEKTLKRLALLDQDCQRYLSCVKKNFFGKLEGQKNSINIYFFNFLITVLRMENSEFKRMRCVFKWGDKQKRISPLVMNAKSLCPFEIVSKTNDRLKVRVYCEEENGKEKKVKKATIVLSYFGKEIGKEEKIALQFKNRKFEGLLEFSIKMLPMTERFEKALELIRDLKKTAGANLSSETSENSNIRITLQNFSNFEFNEEVKGCYLIVEIDSKRRRSRITEETKNVKMDFFVPKDYSGEMCFYFIRKNVVFQKKIKKKDFNNLRHIHQRKNSKSFLHRKKKSTPFLLEVCFENPDPNSNKSNKSKNSENSKTKRKNEAPKLMFELVEKDSVAHIDLGDYSQDIKSLDSKGFGVSLVNQSNEEILYLSLHSISAKLSDFGFKKLLEVKVYGFQIDVSLKKYPQEYRKMVFETPVLKEQVKPFLILSTYEAIEENAGSKSGTSNTFVFDYFCLLVQEIDIKVEESLIKALILFYFEVEDCFAKEGGGKKILKPKNILKFERKPRMFIHVNSLQLNSLAFNVSIKLKENTELSKLLDESLSMRAAGAIIAGIHSVEDVPYRFRANIIKNARGTVETLLKPIAMQYRMQGIIQSYKVLFSLDIIGSPLHLVRNLGDAAYSLFYYPVSGFVSSPEDFAVGVSKGAANFVNSSFKGVFGSVHKFTERIAKEVSDLAPKDQDEYMVEVEKRKISHVGKGLSTGSKSLGKGLYEGISGILTRPVSGAKDHGFEGFVKGVGSGVVGAVTKPVSGALNFFSDTFEGISNTPEFLMQNTDLVNKPKNVVRLPRAPSSDKLKIYNNTFAKGQFIVWKSKRYLREYFELLGLSKHQTFVLPDEKFLAAVEIKNGDTLLVLSDFRLFIIKTKDAEINEGKQMEDLLEDSAIMPLGSIQRIDLFAKKKVLLLKGAQKLDLFGLSESSYEKLVCGSREEATGVFQTVLNTMGSVFPPALRACLGGGSVWVDVTESLNRLAEERKVGLLWSGDFKEIFPAAFGSEQIRGLERATLIVRVQSRSGESGTELVFFDGEPIKL